MISWHHSRKGAESIRKFGLYLIYSLTKTDLGAGFYLLPNFFNAKDWACTKPSNCERGAVMIYNFHLPGDFLTMDLISDDKKWREVVSCTREGMNIHVEDKINVCNYIFDKMSGRNVIQDHCGSENFAHKYQLSKFPPVETFDLQKYKRSCSYV